jgi:hypothetical protein
MRNETVACKYTNKIELDSKSFSFTQVEYEVIWYYQLHEAE